MFCLLEGSSTLLELEPARALTKGEDEGIARGGSVLFELLAWLSGNWY